MASLADLWNRPPRFPESLIPSARAVDDELSFGAVETPAVATRPERRRCGWCPELLPATAHPNARWCSKKCRQTAWRARDLAVVEDLQDTPKRLRIADPPYVDCAKRYYGDQPEYTGEVDHRELLSSMDGFDGWALACSMKSLPLLLTMCPPGIRICIWYKPIAPSPNTRGIHALCEAVLVKPARLRKPGVPDHLTAKPARFGGTLPGRKPLKWCLWVFALLGVGPHDTLDDPYPGTGMVTRAFGQHRSALLRASTAVVSQR